MILSKLILIIFYAFQNTWTFEIPQECQSRSQSTEGGCDNKDTLTNPKLESIEQSLKALSTYSFFCNRVSQLHHANSFLESSMTNLLSGLQKGIPETVKLKAARNDFKKIKIDFDKLTVLSQESDILQKKFSVCLNNCSALKKIEILDNLQSIQKLKIALFIKQPLLVNKVFEKRMNNINPILTENNDRFSVGVFEEDLKQVLLDNLNKIGEKKKEYLKKWKILTKEMF
jgi:hypothetical protein